MGHYQGTKALFSAYPLSSHGLGQLGCSGCSCNYIFLESMILHPQILNKCKYRMKKELVFVVSKILTTKLNEIIETDAIV